MDYLSIAKHMIAEICGVAEDTLLDKKTSSILATIYNAYNKVSEINSLLLTMGDTIGDGDVKGFCIKASETANLLKNQIEQIRTQYMTGE